MAPPPLPLRRYAPTHVTEDTPPDFLEGSMDIEVTLPTGKTVLMNVHRSIPMMDLLIQVTTAHRINPGGHVIQVISDNIFLTYKPSTPIGTLETNAIKIVAKNTLNEMAKKRKANLEQQAVERNIRLKVNLPHNQLAVYRVPPKALISDIFAMVCQEKNLDPESHEMRHPVNVDERLRGSCSVSDYHLSEVCVVSSDFRPPPLSVTDLITMSSIAAQHQSEDKKRRGFLALFSRKAKSSTGDSSVSSGSAGERSVSPARSDESTEGHPTPQALSPASSSGTLTNMNYTNNTTTTTGGHSTSHYHSVSSINSSSRLSRPVSVVSLNKSRKRAAPVPPLEKSRTEHSSSKELANGKSQVKSSKENKQSLSRNSSDSSGYHESDVRSSHTSPSNSEVSSLEITRTTLPPPSNLSTVASSSLLSISSSKGKRKAPPPPKPLSKNGGGPTAIPESPEEVENTQAQVIQTPTKKEILASHSDSSKDELHSSKSLIKEVEVSTSVQKSVTKSSSSVVCEDVRENGNSSKETESIETRNNSINITKISNEEVSSRVETATNNEILSNTHTHTQSSPSKLERTRTEEPQTNTTSESPERKLSPTENGAQGPEDSVPVNVNANVNGNVSTNVNPNVSANVPLNTSKETSTVVEPDVERPVELSPVAESTSHNPSSVPIENETQTRTVSLSSETSGTSIEMLNPKDIQRPKRQKRKKIPEEFFNQSYSSTKETSSSSHSRKNFERVSKEEVKEASRETPTVVKNFEKKANDTPIVIEKEKENGPLKNGERELRTGSEISKTKGMRTITQINGNEKKKLSRDSETHSVVCEDTVDRALTDTYNQGVKEINRRPIMYVEMNNQGESSTDPFSSDPSPKERKLVYTSKVQLLVGDESKTSSHSTKEASTERHAVSVTQITPSESPSSEREDVTKQQEVSKEDVIAELKSAIDTTDDQPRILTLKPKSKDWNGTKSSDYNVILSFGRPGSNRSSATSTLEKKPLARSNSTSSYESVDNVTAKGEDLYIRSSRSGTETSYESAPPPLPESRFPFQSDSDSKPSSSTVSRQSSLSDYDAGREFLKPKVPAFSISTYQSRANKVSYDKKLARSESLSSFTDLHAINDERDTKTMPTDVKKLTRSDSQRNEIYKSTEELKKKSTSTTVLNTNATEWYDIRGVNGSPARPSVVKNLSRSSLLENSHANSSQRMQNGSIQFELSSAKDPITFNRPIPQTFNNLRKAKSTVDVRGSEGRVPEVYQPVPDSGLANEYMRLQDDFMKWQNQLLQNQQVLHNRVAPIAANPPTMNSFGMNNSMANQQSAAPPPQPRKPIEINIPIRLVDDDDDNEPRPQLVKQVNQPMKVSQASPTPFSAPTWKSGPSVPSVPVGAWQERPVHTQRAQPENVQRNQSQPADPYRQFGKQQPGMQTVFQSAPEVGQHQPGAQTSFQSVPEVGQHQPGMQTVYQSVPDIRQHPGMQSGGYQPVQEVRQNQPGMQTVYQSVPEVRQQPGMQPGGFQPVPDVRQSQPGKQTGFQSPPEVRQHQPGMQTVYQSVPDVRQHPGMQPGSFQPVPEVRQNQPGMQTVYQSVPEMRPQPVSQSNFQQVPLSTFQPQSNFQQMPRSSFQPQPSFQQMPQSNLQQIPQSNLQQMPQSNLQQMPQSNLQQMPQSNLQQMPQSNLQQMPQSNLQQMPQSNLQQMPPSGYQQMPPSGYQQVPQPSYQQQVPQSNFQGPPPNSQLASRTHNQPTPPLAPRPQVIPNNVGGLDPSLDENINARFSSVVTLSNDKNDRESSPQKDKVRSIVQLNSEGPSSPPVPSPPFNSKIINNSAKAPEGGERERRNSSNPPSGGPSVTPMSSRLVQQAVQQPPQPVGGFRVSPPRVMERQPSPPNHEPSPPFAGVKLRPVETRISPPKTVPLAPSPPDLGPAPPPPPPPPCKVPMAPPPPPMSEEDRRTSTGKKIFSAANVPQLDAREELMMAIRLFGGSGNLRKSGHPINH